MNEQDNYLLPQALVCLGACAIQAGHDVTLLDCMPLKIGWTKLADIIKRKNPEVVLCGDSETMFAHESGRVFQLAKSLNPSIFTVAGGVHFSFAADDAFAKYPIDAIVRGEGESTLVDLLSALETKKSLANVPGLALPGSDGKANYTGPRELIENLDDLPFPAYDRMPMEKYGTARYLFSPGGVTIHHSRGCTSGCNYCACWLQMAGNTNNNPNNAPTPRWRTRSVLPVVDEMEILAKKYNKHCQVFVDDVWNADPNWSDAFADELIRRNLDINWFAFMRVDHLIRDEKSLLFEKLIASGLRHICVGLERAKTEELDDLGKQNISIDHVNQIIPKLRKKYPKLFLQTTFIVGLKQDSNESLEQLLTYVEKLDPDYPAFHPITPVPGTKMWDIVQKKDWLEIRDFARYDWMTPVMGTDTMTRGQLEAKIWNMNSRYMRLGRVLRGIFSPYSYRRRMYIWWLMVSIRVGWDYLVERFWPGRSTMGKIALSKYVGMVKPDWYD